MARQNTNVFPLTFYWTNPLWLLLAAALTGQVERPLSPADAIAQAHADLSRLPPDARPLVRYLSLYNLTTDNPAMMATMAQRRAKLLPILSGHCNQLSREPDLTPVSVVPGTNAALVRVVLKDYAWDCATWEKLVDPYFTAVIETERVEVVPWAGGLWEGRHYPAGAFTWNRRTKVKTQALAPWLTETPEQQRMLAEVVAWTQSKAPVVRADYFLSQTSAAEDRSPNYYDFLGVKDEASFQEMVGVDVKLAQKFFAIGRDAVSISDITKYDRAILVVGKIRGHYYKTLDLKKKSAGSALRVLGPEIEKHFDASEQIGGLPNQLLAYGLFNNKGERQDKAPDDIVKFRVDVYRSCIECHDNGGLRDITSWVAPLMKGPLELKSPDYDTSRQLRREYLEGLQHSIQEDRARYDRRIKELTGLDSKAFSRGIVAAIHQYEDTPVDLAISAADLGTTPQRWKAALQNRLRTNRGDTVLAPLSEGGLILRAVWETAVPEAHLILRDYAQ